MTWKPGTLKLDIANTIFEDIAVFSKHTLGYYEAHLNNGEILQHQYCSELGKMVIDRCSELGLKRLP